MIFKKRYVLHAGFWLLYFSILFFNELFLTSGRDDEVTFKMVVQNFLSEFTLMLLKIGITYAVLYYFMPRWLKSSDKLIQSLKFALVLLTYVLLYRLFIQHISWPYIISIQPELSFQSQLARYFYSLLEILQILGISVTIKLLRMKIENSKLEKELMKEKRSTELIRLKAQIHPHFLFNVLNSVYSLSRNNPEKTSDIILKMSDLLRFMLYESDKKLITLQNEIKIIKDYIQLQQIRFDNKVNVETSIESDNPQAAITPLIIFPLIENAFKHGIGARSDNSYIKFRLVQKGNNLSVETKNAILEHSVKNDNNRGIGQQNIKKQLEILYKEHTFNCTEYAGEYQVFMHINLNTYVDVELLNN
jgi:two-component system, LytTR family, sensor kinase